MSIRSSHRLPAIGFLFSAVSSLATGQSGAGWVSFPLKEGPGGGRHVVLIAGDEEYRSEESMPMLARILSERQGFKTTVLFSIDEQGFIDPKAGGSLGKPETLDSADALVICIRFRHWPDETMKKFEAAINRGVPVIALRTSTHAFNFPKDSPWSTWSYNNAGGFGKKFLGESWVTHWGHHGKQATRAVPESAAEGNPLLRGVGGIFADSDVYEAYPPQDATILLRGQVLESMSRTAEPLDIEKARATDKVSQKVNEPAMPVAWTREVRNEAGSINKVMTTTMGAATDLEDESLRRLVVNALFWGLAIQVPAKADVSPVGEYLPTKFKLDGHQQGVKAADFLVR